MRMGDSMDGFDGFFILTKQRNYVASMFFSNVIVFGSDVYSRSGFRLCLNLFICWYFLLSVF